MNFLDYCRQPPLAAQPGVDLAGQCELAEQELRAENRAGETSVLELREESERLRWFVLPQDLLGELAIVDGPNRKEIKTC